MPTCVIRYRQDLMAELDECLGEFMWGSLVFYRQWGVQARDLLLRPPEWRVSWPTLHHASSIDVPSGVCAQS